MANYPTENLLREATELYTSLTLFALAGLTFLRPHYFLLTQEMGTYALFALGSLALYRGLQGLRVKRYHWRLIKMPYYALSTTEIPVSEKWLFVGRGFRWFPHHTQRLQQIKQIKNERFMQRGKLYQSVRHFCQKYEGIFLTRWFNKPLRLNPFRPDPPVGGSPFLHGLGEEDRPIYIPQEVRVGHTFVVGTTRVGKTRLASILINQDIRNGDAVIVVDPKGDFELMHDMMLACKAANRLDDFRIVHLGFPEVSAKYNPLKNYDQVSEIATRITDAIPAEGEGKQFAAFAWKYVNIVSTCLAEMNEAINYSSIAFYISRLDQLLMVYADKIMPNYCTDYHHQIEGIMQAYEEKANRKNKSVSPKSRAAAVAQFIKSFIAERIHTGNTKELQSSMLVELYDATLLDKQYYDKIIASVGPVLSEINQSNAASIFSSASNNEIELMSVIKEKKVIYLGLDSLTNPNIAQAVGKAFLSDLVSTAGKIYKQNDAKYRLNLHCDELSEIIQDSFIKILNKAGGAGFQITAYAQTIQDMEVSLGSKAKAGMTEGNFNTLIMLRVKNEETANLLIKVLPQVEVINHTQVSMVNDTPHGNDGVYFNTTNEDRVKTTAVSMIEVSDIVSLPKGQAFVLVNGGEIYKIRIPLQLNIRENYQDYKNLINNINNI